MTPEEEMVRALQNAHTGEDLECHCWHGAELLKACAKVAETAKSAFHMMEAVGDRLTDEVSYQL